MSGEQLCACGCGAPTWAGRAFVRGHHNRSAANRQRVSAQRRNSAKLHLNAHGYVVVAGRYQHILIAESVLGRKLPPGVEVHHVNEVRSDNRHSNLVICQNHAYHHLLHVRAAALDACGHADWRRCRGCRRWDAPSNLKPLSPRSFAHAHCLPAVRRGEKNAHV